MHYATQVKVKSKGKSLKLLQYREKRHVVATFKEMYLRVYVNNRIVLSLRTNIFLYRNHQVPSNFFKIHWL